jgi:hypothetical protein
MVFQPAQAKRRQHGQQQGGGDHELDGEPQQSDARQFGQERVKHAVLAQSQDQCQQCDNGKHPCRALTRPHPRQHGQQENERANVIG